uniref:Uncharacterized protein n=1 Tax=viral metagenome TaxID=1070528 RepID=A0A6C0LKQ0_9ZZZZ
MNSTDGIIILLCCTLILFVLYPNLLGGLYDKPAEIKGFINNSKRPNVFLVRQNDFRSKDTVPFKTATGALIDNKGRILSPSRT